MLGTLSGAGCARAPFLLRPGWGTDWDLRSLRLLLVAQELCISALPQLRLSLRIRCSGPRQLLGSEVLDALLPQRAPAERERM